MAQVTLSDLNKIYPAGDGSVHAVKDLNLTVKDGEYVALLGPSGCGKTSTLRMIVGLEDITSGTIAFDGRPVKRKTPLFWFFSPSRPVCALREGNYSIVADPDVDLPQDNLFLEESIGAIKAAKLVNFRLYDLRADIRQERDLAQGQNAVLRRMKEKIIRLHADVIREAYDWRESLAD